MTTEKEEFLGCGSNSCYFDKPRGIGNNGGCTCLKELPIEKRIKVQKYILRLKQKLKET